MQMPFLLLATNSKRAPLTVYPGSHRAHFDAWEEQLSNGDLDRRALPRIVGCRAAQLPTPQREAVPCEAKQGQVTILTTAVLHSASDNSDTQPRLVLNPSFTAVGVTIALPPPQAEKKVEFDALANRVLRPGIRPTAGSVIADPFAAQPKL